eukprot:5006124-Prymnesium_polylepis.1
MPSRRAGTTDRSPTAPKPRRPAAHAARRTVCLDSSTHTAAVLPLPTSAAPTETERPYCGLRPSVTVSSWLPIALRGAPGHWPCVAV